MSLDRPQSSSSRLGSADADGLRHSLDLSVIIPALNEGRNLELLLPELRRTLSETVGAFQIIIVTGEMDDLTLNAAKTNSASVILQTERGYGGALIKGLAEARGDYVLTMDADLSHPPIVVRDLWSARFKADVMVASRYVPGGRAEMPLIRYLLSRILNGVFRIGFGLNIHDLSSGFRLYQREVITNLPLVSRDFDILQEILVKSHVSGRTLAEIPFVYKPRRHGNSHARVFRFGLAYLRTFRGLRKLRNSTSRSGSGRSS